MSSSAIRNGAKVLTKGSKQIVSRRISSSVIRTGGAGGGPMMPPFARLKPPTSTLPEEVELVWNDSVAPETCIDFDAPHVSINEVYWSMLAVASAFGALYTYVVLSDPEASNPVALRSTVIPSTYLADLGMASDDDAEEEDDE